MFFVLVFVRDGGVGGGEVLIPQARHYFLPKKVGGSSKKVPLGVYKPRKALAMSFSLNTDLWLNRCLGTTNRIAIFLVGIVQCQL